jgi:micrococcal nuclease
VSRLLLLLALCAAVAGCGELSFSAAPSERRTADVERVVDGDTVVLSGLGKARLIGVDTPEVYGGVECYGRAASRYAKRVLDGRRVRWRYDTEHRDRYDRALVYLWLEDGRFFNSMLVREGFAQPMTIPPNVEFADRFVADARAARRAGRGLWRAC